MIIPSRNDLARLLPFLQEKILFSCILQDPARIEQGLAGILQEYTCRICIILAGILQDPARFYKMQEKRTFSCKIVSTGYRL